MKRNAFIASVIAMAAAPVVSFSNINRFFTGTRKGFKIKSGEGRLHGHIKLKSVNANILDLKVSGKDTEGALAIFEQTSLSQGRGTPLHIHYSQDEVFNVLEGKYFFQVGDEKFDLTAGDSIFLPRNIPHAWTQVSEKGRMTVILQSAGKLEDFFLSMAAMDHEPTSHETSKIFAVTI